MKFTFTKNQVTFFSVIFLLQLFTIVKASTLDGVITAGEYGTHTNGLNQQTSGSSVVYMNWDATNLYVAVTAANVAEGFVLYLDKDPQVPVNGGTNANGTQVGFNYDGVSFANLQFRADLVMYVKNSYREYRTADGSNGWSAPTSGFGSYADDASAIREISIPWSAIGGMPSAFNFFSFVTSSTGFVYAQVPSENAGGFVGTTARYARYYTVSVTSIGSETPPFSRNSYVFNSTTDISSFGAINVYDFTMNSAGRFISRTGATTQNWVINGNLVMGAGTIFFGSGGVNGTYGTTTVTGNVNFVGGGTINMDQTTSPLTINGNLLLTSGTLALSANGFGGGDLSLAGNLVMLGGGGTLTTNNRAVFLTGNTNTTFGTTNNWGIIFDYLFINKTFPAYCEIPNSSGAISVNQNLTLNGVVKTNSPHINITWGATVTRNSGWVNGKINMPFSIANPTWTFHVGDANYYTPIVVTVNGITGNGLIMGYSLPGNSPNIGSSTFNPTQTIARRFGISNYNLGSQYSSYTATCNWDAADVQGGVNTATIYAGIYGPWTYPNVSNRTATSAQINNATLFSEIQFGDCVAPTLNTSQNNITCTLPLGDATVTATGGSTPYSYLWSNSQTTATATGLAAGTYTVTVTANGGCSVSTQVTITSNTTPPSVSASASPDPICQGASTTLTGTGASTYSWMPGSLNGTTVSVSPAATTTYTVTGTDAGNGCTATATVEVTVTPAPACQNGGTVDLGTCSCLCLSGYGGVLCEVQCATGATAGALNTTVCDGGDIELTSSATGTTLAYSWSGPNSFTSTEQNPVISSVGLAANGTYTVTISNSCGSTSSSVSVTVVANPTITLTNTINICQGATSFSIPYSATTGSPDEYYIEAGTPAYPNFIANSYPLTASPLTVSVDGSAAPGAYLFSLEVINTSVPCLSGLQTITLNVIATPAAGITNNTGTTVISCANTSISLTATGGGTYLWDNGSTDANRSVSIAGTYTVTVTNNGCTASSQITITGNSTPPTAVITPSSGTLTCAVTSINLVASGGTSYLWDDGSTNASRNVSAAGTYTVTVTDASNGCTASTQAVIGISTAPPVALISPPSGTLNCTTTSIVLTASGGTTYLWDNGSTNAARTVTTAGTYTVTVTDGTNGCTASTQAVIGSNTTAPTAVITPSSGTITCSTTSINLVASGGISYLWDNGSTNAARTVTLAGTYTVTVTDPGSGCTATATAVIGSSVTPPSVSASAVPAAVCPGSPATLTATGAVTYTWAPATGLSATTGATVTASPAASTTYTVTGTDVNGCTATATVSITFNPTPIVNTSVKSNAYLGGATGSAGITATPSGCSILWSPGGETTNYISSKPAGTYTVTVTSPAGCVKTKTIIIN